MEAYEALVSNHVRGIIYLHGNNVVITSESFMEGMSSTTHRIVSARPMGKKKNDDSRHV